MSADKLRICPRCKKTGIEIFPGEASLYKHRCGYVGPIVEEIELKRKKDTHG